MKTEALIGKELGTSTLQRLIGRGTLGAVYLAQQSRPHRQVAVKVFLRATSLEPALLAEFLERFQREVDAASSLEHPNILSIHEYGERDDLAYMVMPYARHGTLRDLLERDGALPLTTAADYLEQLAAAVDFAHGKRVLHRDIKPGNILISSDSRLVLADFGLTNVVAEEKMAQVRLAEAGMLDYMAPEQIMGKKIDARADLYSLGVVLYHMVTGTVPFKGDTLMQVAVQHLQTPPKAPRSLRKDLPPAAEQVMLRAMVKQPAERYEHAQDLAVAFRLAIAATGVQLNNGPQNILPGIGPTEKTQFHRPRSLFDPRWQTEALTAISNEQPQNAQDAVLPDAGARGTTGRATLRGAPGIKKHLLRPDDEKETPSTAMPMFDMAARPGPERIPPAFTLQSTGTFPGISNMQQPTEMPGVTSQLHPAAMASSNTDTQTPLTQVKPGPISPFPGIGTTGALATPNYEQGNTGTIKLTGPAKVVRVPLAGQPGQYVTRLLSILPEAEPEKSPAPGKKKIALTGKVKILAAALLILLLAGSGVFIFAKTLGNRSKAQNKSVTAIKTPDVPATATAQAKATAEANIILSDPLDENIHNWIVSTTGAKLYQFKDGAYHITNNDPAQGAPAILPDETLSTSFGYALTMEEIKGDDTSNTNAFGMILRATSQERSGQTITTFYSFEVVNMAGGEYQFWKYDNSQGSNVNPWNELWHHNFGSEFHQGHGPHSINSFKIFANGKNFTLIVNGKQVGTVHDGSFSSGAVGMLVNQKGTEVAFSNLLLTRN